MTQGFWRLAMRDERAYPSRPGRIRVNLMSGTQATGEDGDVFSAVGAEYL